MAENVMSEELKQLRYFDCWVTQIMIRVGRVNELDRHHERPAKIEKLWPRFEALDAKLNEVMHEANLLSEELGL